MKRFGVFAFTFLGLVGLASAVAVAPTRGNARLVTIATGGITGVYHPVGNAICRLVNGGRKEHGVRCSVIASDGSLANVGSLNERRVDVALVQADVEEEAVRGTGVFAKAGPNSNLRSVLALHAEAFTVVARADVAIRTFTDLRGKRVSVGAPGSGTRTMMSTVLEAHGLGLGDLAAAEQLKPEQMAAALCAGRIDAFAYVIGHPNASIAEAATSCRVNVVLLAPQAIETVLAQRPYYTRAVVPGGVYPGIQTDSSTIGLRAVLMTTVELPDDLAYTLARTMTEQQARFARMQPSLKDWSAESALTGLLAPVHPGAARYFRERGLLR